MARTALATFAALLLGAGLAACSNNEDAGSEATPGGVAAAAGSAEPDGMDVRDRTEPEPDPAVATPDDGGEIPMAMRGRWGLVPADCTSTRGDAKGLLAIDAGTLRFYESVGTLKATVERADDRLRGDFAFTGEGMEWTREMVLEVGEGGRTLIRREFGKDAQPGPFTYRRCA